MRELIAEGRKVTAPQYLAALDLARSLATGLNDLFNECNAIITPAAPGVAPKGLQSTGSPVFCSLWSLTGLPALSLPLLEGEDGLPLGVQIVGAKNDDARLFRNAAWLVNALAPKSAPRRRRAR
jgi:Asp-tRNA(Asn)/Glu-tRNA(Gln) amidotransferase A subunit family amidase